MKRLHIGLGGAALAGVMMLASLPAQAWWGSGWGGPWHGGPWYGYPGYGYGGYPGYGWGGYPGYGWGGYPYYGGYPAWGYPYAVAPVVAAPAAPSSSDK